MQLPTFLKSRQRNQTPQVTHYHLSLDEAVELFEARPLKRVDDPSERKEAPRYQFDAEQYKGTLSRTQELFAQHYRLQILREGQGERVVLADYWHFAPYTGKADPANAQIRILFEKHHAARALEERERALTALSTRQA